MCITDSVRFQMFATLLRCEIFCAAEERAQVLLTYNNPRHTYHHTPVLTQERDVTPATTHLY